MHSSLSMVVPFLLVSATDELPVASYESVVELEKQELFIALHEEEEVMPADTIHLPPKMLQKKSYGHFRDPSFKSEQAYRAGNAGIIDAARHIVRSAQPTHSGYQVLQKEPYAIHTVLRLNATKETPQINGLKFVTMGMHSSPPTREQYENIKKLYRAGHLLIHCQHGADRTGAVIARLRRDVDGWELEEALAEYFFYNQKTDPSMPGAKEHIYANRRLLHWVVTGERIKEPDMPKLMKTLRDAK